MNSVKNKPKPGGLVIYRRVLYLLLILVSVIYVFYGYKKSPFFYYYFIAGGCLIIALLFKSYIDNGKFRRWFGKNIEENYFFTWFAGSALICLPYVFITLQLLQLRKKTELYFLNQKPSGRKLFRPGYILNLFVNEEFPRHLIIMLFDIKRIAV